MKDLDKQKAERGRSATKEELDYLLFLSLVIIFVMLLCIVWFMMSGQPLAAVSY